MASRFCCFFAWSVNGRTVVRSFYAVCAADIFLGLYSLLLLVGRFCLKLVGGSLPAPLLSLVFVHRHVVLRSPFFGAGDSRLRLFCRVLQCLAVFSPLASCPAARSSLFLRLLSPPRRRFAFSDPFFLFSRAAGAFPFPVSAAVRLPWV